MRILIVNDSPVCDQVFVSALRDNGADVIVADSPREAVTIGAGYQPDLAIVNLRMCNGPGRDLVRCLRRASPSTVFVVVAGDHARRGDAARAGGGTDLLEDADELLSFAGGVVRERAREAGDGLGADFTAHAAARWAAVVVRVIDCPTDPKTIAAWSRWVAASPGAVRNWCRTAGVAAKRSLDFARVLRAVVRQTPGVPPQHMLDAVDLRTLRCLLRLGRPGPATVNALPATIEEFLESQRWVTSAPVLAEVRHALAARKLDGIALAGGAAPAQP